MSKKIAIISDTHDNSLAVVWIIEYLNEHNISMAFHAGDIINPGIIGRFANYYNGNLHFVFGNNDGETARLSALADNNESITCHRQELRLEHDGKRIFMNHYSSISESMAKSGEFDLTIGGHDHTYRVVQHDVCYFVNPGCTLTKDKWLGDDEDSQSSFVVFDLETMKHERVIVPS